MIQEKGFLVYGGKNKRQKLPNRKERKACANQALLCEPSGLFLHPLQLRI
jgi:hypothetical protein